MLRASILSILFVFNLPVLAQDEINWDDFDNKDSWIFHCSVQFMYDNTGGIYPNEKQRACNFGVTFGDDEGHFIRKTFSCSPADGELSCFKHLTKKDLGLLDGWYPKSAWTNSDLYPKEIRDGCVYMYPYPTALAIVYKDIPTLEGFKDYLQVKVIKRLSCSNKSAPSQGAVAPTKISDPSFYLPIVAK